MNIEGLSIHVLAEELNNELSGGRIQRILQPTRYLFVFRIRHADRELSLAVSVDPADPRVHLTRESRENPPEPSSFCMLLRKHLLDGRIAAVVQQDGLDRVLHLTVDIRSGPGRIETRTLTMELAGKNSNLILISDGLIVDAVRRVGRNTSRFRQVLPGALYVPPPVRPRLNPLAAGPEEVAAATASCTGQPLGKALMNVLEGVGPAGVSEILFRAGLNSVQAADRLSREELTSLQTAFASFRAPFLVPPTPAYAACNAAGELLAVGAFRPDHLKAAELRTFRSMNEALEFGATRTAAPKTTLHQDTLRRARSELDRLIKKRTLLAEELAASLNADEYRVSADLLLGGLHLVSQGLTKVSVPDYYAAPAPDGMPPLREIALDPSLPPMANVQRFYRKYARARRAQEMIRIQMEQCREEIQYLEGVVLSLGELLSRQELLEIIQELAGAGYLPASPRARIPARPSEPRRIVLPSGAVLFIGRNNRQNDLVTFKVARPGDLWFHTKDIPGSHVVLRTPDGPPLPADMEMAAMLAAWFSKARESASVPVDYTERRHVKKPSGAKPGFVIYEKQRTVRVTPQSGTVAALLRDRLTPSSPG